MLHYYPHSSFFNHLQWYTKLSIVAYGSAIPILPNMIFLKSKYSFHQDKT